MTQVLSWHTEHKIEENIKRKTKNRVRREGIILGHLIRCCPLEGSCSGSFGGLRVCQLCCTLGVPTRAHFWHCLFFIFCLVFLGYLISFVFGLHLVGVCAFRMKHICACAWSIVVLPRETHVYFLYEKHVCTFVLLKSEALMCFHVKNNCTFSIKVKHNVL